MTKTQQELEDEPFWLWWDENIMVCSHDYRSKKTGIVISSNEFKDCWIKSRQQSDVRIKQLEDQLLERDTRTILSWIGRKQFFGHSPISIMQIIEDILKLRLRKNWKNIETCQKLTLKSMMRIKCCLMKDYRK